MGQVEKSILAGSGRKQLNSTSDLSFHGEENLWVQGHLGENQH